MKQSIHRIILASLCLFSISATSVAQNAPITFEPGGHGNSWTWNVFENSTNPAVQMVANPSPGGINTSATVARFTALQAGQPYAGFENIHPGSVPSGASPFGTFTLSASNSTIKIMVYKSVISDVGIKFATASNASTGEIKVANTMINQWQELTFDFSSKIGEPSSTGIDQIIIFPDFQVSPVRNSDNICYIDNITFSPTVAPAAPTAAAPTPTRPPANVISLFSNPYTNVPNNTWLASYSNGALTNVQIAGNDTKKYSNVDFVAAEFLGPNSINASTMAFFHLDAWTPNMTAFRIKLVDFGANNIFGGGDDSEHELSFTPTLNGWNSYEIDLTSFTNLTGKAHIAQLILSGNPSGAGTVYVDNIYFHNITNDPIVAAPTPMVAAANVISMFSHQYANVPVNTWRTSWSVATLTNVNVAGNATKKYTGLDFVGVETTGANLINATGMNTFNVDIWTPNMTTFRVKLVDWGPNGVWNGTAPGSDDTEHELVFTPTLSGWNSYHIPLANFTGLASRAKLAQYIFSGLPAGLGTLYVDNVYFSNVTTPLPLTLSSFTATVQNQDVSLRWITTDEENVSDFEVQHSTDGVHFESFATVKAMNTPGEHNYSATDPGITQTTYYRLKMNDIDGGINYSTVEEVNLVDANQQLSVYPNPATDQLIIQYNGATKAYNKAEILNSLGGKIIQVELNNGSTTVDISGLPAGNYFVQSAKGQIVRFTKK